MLKKGKNEGITAGIEMNSFLCAEKESRKICDLTRGANSGLN